MKPECYGHHVTDGTHEQVARLLGFIIIIIIIIIIIRSL